MALKVNVPGGLSIYDNAFEANEALNTQYLCVIPVAASSGKMKVGLPGGQGVIFMGILQEITASGAQAPVRLLGETKCIAAGAHNNGIELTIDGSSGKLSAAASGDYVVGIAKEASAEADQVVTVQMIGMYQKN